MALLVSSCLSVFADSEGSVSLKTLRTIVGLFLPDTALQSNNPKHIHFFLSAIPEYQRFGIHLDVFYKYQQREIMEGIYNQQVF